MDVFGSIANWANSAWDGLQSVGGSFFDALNKVWHLSASIVMALGWLVLQIISPGFTIVYNEEQALFQIVRALRDAIDRVGWWVWETMILPTRADYITRIFVLQQIMLVKFQQLTNLVYVLYFVERQYTEVLVATERNQRIADIKAARAYALALTQQLHQTIENEAVSGYKAGLGIRTTMLQQLAEDLNVRGILDTVTTKLLIKAADALVDVEDPLLAAVANRIIGEIIRKSGLGADLGDLLDRLIDPSSNGGTPKDLPGVIEAITHRIGELEDWVSQFMLDGGPEVEDAGRQWKVLNSLVVDAGLLAFFGQAVLQPEAWAREVNDVVETVADATIGSIMDLIRHV